MKPIKIYNEFNRFVVDWTLNTLCTYKCSYCPPSLNSGQNIIFQKESDNIIVSRFLENLQRQTKDKSVHVFLNGGEPTISHVFETIIDFIEDAGWCAYVSTNGSRTIDWWRRYAPKIFKISVSYHPEFADDTIFEKVREIGKLTNVGVFVLMYPPYWNKSVEAFEKFRQFPNITLEPSRIFRREEIGSHDKSYEYSESQLQWLTENSGLNIRAEKIIKLAPENNIFGETKVQYDNGFVERLDEVLWTNLRKNSFIGWHCNMGMDHILIRGNGDILQSACNQAKKLGNIRNFSTLDKEPTLCRMDWCMCTADIQIPKTSI
jgi:MoaA/NifB/PqqE/SkfB family radical SAM enzyme